MKFSIRRVNEWLIVLLLLALFPIVFFFIWGDAYFLSNNLHHFFNMRPSTIILGLNSKDAIEIFGGNTPSGYSYTWETISMYLNVVLYLMFGPYVFFKGFKKAKENENRAKPWYWYIGGAICLGALSIIPVEVIHQKVLENTKESVAENRIRDMMRAELAEVGFATAQYEIIEDGVGESFKIDDLNLEGLKFDYTVENIASDTLITLQVSNPDVTDFTVKMEVRPYNRRLLTQRN